MTDVTLPEALWTRLTEALGLEPDTEPETVVVAVEELTLAPASENAVAAAAALASAGRDALDQLKADAEQGRILAAAAKKRDITDLLTDAMRRGKIPPSREKHWFNLLSADPAMRETLEAIPDNTIPVKEIGHDGDGVGGTEVVEPAGWFR
ncbi:hypothetical protein [Prescottella agglutinans]|uniref:hypothetical protein n=1 Tax=Prescottella agglutinans TaxID=1644129 RepID=UPI003D9844DA